MRSFSKGWVFEAGPYMFYYTYEREERPLEVEDLGDGSSLKLVDPKVLESRGLRFLCTA